jgi:hypothetical protein
MVQASSRKERIDLTAPFGESSQQKQLQEQQLRRLSADFGGQRKGPGDLSPGPLSFEELNVRTWRSSLAEQVDVPASHTRYV